MFDGLKGKFGWALAGAASLAPFGVKPGAAGAQPATGRLGAAVRGPQGKRRCQSRALPGGRHVLLQRGLGQNWAGRPAPPAPVPS